MSYQIVNQDKDEVRVRSGRKQVFVLKAEKPVIEEVALRSATIKRRAESPVSEEEEDHIDTVWLQVEEEAPRKHKPVTAKRRVYHNEIERQRRNKINTWITELGKLVPEEETEGAPSSKVQILERACQFVEDIKEKNDEMKKVLRQVTCENRSLKHENEKLKKQLKFNDESE